MGGMTEEKQKLRAQKGKLRKRKKNKVQQQTGKQSDR